MTEAPHAMNPPQVPPGQPQISPAPPGGSPGPVAPVPAALGPVAPGPGALGPAALSSAAAGPGALGPAALGPAARVPVPGPPRGPGVHPPFPAPPTEGRRLRIGWGLGLGAALVLLICGGAVVAVVGLATVMSSAVSEQAQVVVGEYLDDVQARRYGEAYDALCDSTRAQLTEAEFSSEQAAQPAIRSYHVGSVDLTDVDLAVPVDVTYADGDTGRLQAYLGQDQQTGRFQVCRVEE